MFPLSNIDERNRDEEVLFDAFGCQGIYTFSLTQRCDLIQRYASIPPEVSRNTQYSHIPHLGLSLTPSFMSHGWIRPSTLCTPRNKLVDNILYVNLNC